MNKIEKLIKELCPNGVEWKKLGEVCVHICSGGTPNSKNSAYYNGEIPWLRTQEIDFRDIYETGMTITQEGLDNSSAKWIPANCVIVAMYGATVGKIGINKIPLTTNQACCNLEINNQIALYKYVFYCLTSQYEYIKSLGEGSQTNINAQIVKNLSIPLPPLPIQTEIVRILDKFVEQQEQIERLIELRKKQYEYYREEMLKNVNGERGKLIDLLIQPITDGPHVTPKFVDEGIPFISATAIYDGKIHLKDAQGFVTKDFDKECSKKYKPKKFDVYMVKSGSTTGKVALVDFDDDFNVWSPLAAMRTQNEIQAKYLYHLLQTSNIQNQVLLGMSQGSQPNLSMRTLEQFNVIIPNNEEQERIVNVLDKIESNVFIMKSALEASKRRYKYYRDKMMRF